MFRSLVFAFLMVFLASSAVVAEGRAPVPAPEERQVVYVSPFQAVMVPAEIEETVFDGVVDRLNELGAPLGYRFLILKEPPADAEWLGRQIRVDGELFGYLEESGCCYTEIRLRSRVRLQRPEAAPVVIEYPRDLFFENDYTSIEAERRQLAEEAAAALAAQVLDALAAS